MYSHFLPDVHESLRLLGVSLLNPLLSPEQSCAFAGVEPVHLGVGLGPCSHLFLATLNVYPLSQMYSHFLRVHPDTSVLAVSLVNPLFAPEHKREFCGVLPVQLKLLGGVLILSQIPFGPLYLYPLLQVYSHFLFVQLLTSLLEVSLFNPLSSPEQS